MDIKIDDLRAFLVIYENKSFTGASSVLGLSQSALSQKVARIEDILQASLFIREPRSLSLTSAGEKLLVYAKDTLDMQKDFLSEFDATSSTIAGHIRIATYSSIIDSLIIPRLAPMMKEHSNLNIEFQVYEMYELEKILKFNQADFIIADYFPNLSQTHELEIGKEEYVIIKSKKHSAPNIFIDHTPTDNATSSYFKSMKLKADYKRRFLGSVYSIIEGVANGVGQAVMSKHLIENDKRLIIDKKKKAYIRPIVLIYKKRNYYSGAHKAIIDLLKLGLM